MTDQSLLFPILKAKILGEILEWQLMFFSGLVILVVFYKWYEKLLLPIGSFWLIGNYQVGNYQPLIGTYEKSIPGQEPRQVFRAVPDLRPRPRARLPRADHLRRGGRAPADHARARGQQHCEDVQDLPHVLRPGERGQRHVVALRVRQGRRLTRRRALRA